MAPCYFERVICPHTLRCFCCATLTSNAAVCSCPDFSCVRLNNLPLLRACNNKQACFAGLDASSVWVDLCFLSCILSHFCTCCTQANTGRSKEARDLWTRTLQPWRQQSTYLETEVDTYGMSLRASRSGRCS